MQDREPQVGREGRVRITQDDGTIIEGVLEMADNATIQGTPYNKATQLSDAVAQALKLTPVEEATVNDALGLLPGLISDLNNVQLSMLTVETGTYTGNGKSGSANPNSITFSFVPDVVFIINSSATGTNDTYQATLFPKTSATQRSDYLVTNGSNSNSVFGYTLSVSMNGNTLEWYSSSADRQLNESGDNYDWYAIGQKFDNTVTVSCKNSSGALQDGCVVTLGENDPVVSNSTEPLVFKTVSQNPVLTVVSPIDYGGEVQTQTLDLSNTQNLSVDVTVDTSTHVTSGTITSSIVGAFSSQVTSIDVFCLGGGGNGFLSQYLIGYTIDLYGSGGAGGGYAVKNNLDVSENLIMIVPGGRAGTSYFSVGDNIACRATGGGNGNSAVINVRPPSPGVGNVGDTLLSGATPGWFQIQSNGRYAPVNAVAGEYSTDPFSGESIGGAGYSSFSKDSSPAYYGATQPIQNGGGGTVYQQDGTAPGAGGGGMTNRYAEGEEYTRAGYGTAGYVKWRVAQ